jgi:2-iminobutanoate/2-iminopropanoate deaminase
MKKIETDAVVLPGKSPHSQAIEANGFVFTQGMIYLTPEGSLLEGTLEEKVTLILKNIQAVLKEAGADFSNVVKVTVYVTDMSSYATINQVYSEYFSEPYPAREVVCVKALPLGAEVEISMIAEKVVE